MKKQNRILNEQEPQQEFQNYLKNLGFFRNGTNFFSNDEALPREQNQILVIIFW